MGAVIVVGVNRDDGAWWVVDGAKSSERRAMVRGLWRGEGIRVGMGSDQKEFLQAWIAVGFDYSSNRFVLWDCIHP